MIGLSQYLSIATLNTNALSFPIKRHIRELNQETKSIYLLPTIHIDNERMEKMFHANWKEADIAMLITDKTDFSIKTIKGDEGHYEVIKGSFQQEEITIVNSYALNVRAPGYVKHMFTNLKGDIDSNTVTMGNLQTLLHQ